MGYSPWLALWGKLIPLCLPDFWDLKSACLVKAASDFGGPFLRWMELNTGFCVPARYTCQVYLPGLLTQKRA